MDKNVAELKICSTELDEVTKKQERLNYLHFKNCTLYKVCKCRAIHVPMGRARREKSTSQLDDDDDGGKYVCNHHWCVQTANRKMTWLCGIGFWCLLESLYLA